MKEMENERKLREFIESFITNPCYGLQGKNWAHGAIDFACYSGLISLYIRDLLMEEYQLNH